MIIKEARGVGATVESAREDALKKLGAGIDEDVSVDVIALPKKKVLGLFGGSMAEVRAYVEVEDKPQKQRQDRQPKSEKKFDKKPVQQKKAETAKPAAAKASVEVAAEAEESVGVPAEQVDKNSPAGRAYAYLSEILGKLGCDGISATIADVEGGSKITLAGSDKLGVIIGRRGETLDALQYLASLIANENGGGYYRIVIDIGNYREKREVTLESLARRTASQVLRTGRNRSLEPMNPYERRIIHTTVQGIDGVTSMSIGDGANRRVVICVEGKPYRPYNGRGREGGNRDGGRRRQGFGGRTARTAAPANTGDRPERPKEVDGTKLYGKLTGNDTAAADKQ